MSGFKRIIIINNNNEWNVYVLRFSVGWWRRLRVEWATERILYFSIHPKAVWRHRFRNDGCCYNCLLLHSFRSFFTIFFFALRIAGVFVCVDNDDDYIMIIIGEPIHCVWLNWWSNGWRATAHFPLARRKIVFSSSSATENFLERAGAFPHTHTHTSSSSSSLSLFILYYHQLAIVATQAISKWGRDIMLTKFVHSFIFDEIVFRV